jgi:hypothetical protein
MDGSHFDAWTRRRFGLAMGGGVAALLGLSALDNADAKHKKKKCIKKPRVACGGKKKCCKSEDLSCGEILGLSGKNCCRNVQGVCKDANQCCGDFICDQIDGLGDQTRCCGAADRSCSEDQDCCSGFTCNPTSKKCEV